MGRWGRGRGRTWDGGCEAFAAGARLARELGKNVRELRAEGFFGRLWGGAGCSCGGGWGFHGEVGRGRGGSGGGRSGRERRVSWRLGLKSTGGLEGIAKEREGDIKRVQVSRCDSRGTGRCTSSLRPASILSRDLPPPRRGPARRDTEPTLTPPPPWPAQAPVPARPQPRRAR